MADEEGYQTKSAINSRLIIVGLLLFIGLVGVAILTGIPGGNGKRFAQIFLSQVVDSTAADENATVTSETSKKEPPLLPNPVTSEPSKKEPLLAKPVKIHKNVTSVVIMAQMRGGSSFLSSVFASNPDVCFWFEPGQCIYNHIFGHHANIHPDETQLNNALQTREISEYETVWMTTYLSEMLSNRVADLPRDMFYDPMITSRVDPKRKGFRDCVKSVKGQSQFGKGCGEVNPRLYLDCYKWNGKTQNNGMVVKNVPRCQIVEDILKCKRQANRKFINHMDPKCENLVKLFVANCAKKPISAMKLIRVRLSYALPLLKVNSNLKIIHYVRDPRGILSSRMKIFLKHMQPPNWADSNWNIYAVGLCTRMLDDIASAATIKRLYPKNIMTLRYEDLAAEPTKYSKRLYEFIGYKIPQYVGKKVNESVLSEFDWGKFDTIRKNSTATSIAWRSKLDPEKKALFTKACKKVLDHYHYKV